jgi:hypothetical protein
MEIQTPTHEPETPIAVAPQSAAAPRGDFSRITAQDLMHAPVDKERIAGWISQLVDAEVARQNYAYDRALAREFALSGQFDDLKGATAEQAIATAMVKIQLGRSWGFNAADSMRYIYFANGRPSIENEIVAAKLQQGGYDWDVEWLEEEAQHKGKPWRRCVGCRLWIKKWNAQQQLYVAITDRNGEPVSVAFTEADADHAQIWEKGKQIPLSQKWNFQSWGRDMYYWRTISRVKKYHAPHVLRGGVSREEALEMMPLDTLRPPDLPVDLALPEGPADAADQPVAARSTLRDRILQHEGFSHAPTIETADQPQDLGGDTAK